MTDKFTAQEATIGEHHEEMMLMGTMNKNKKVQRLEVLYCKLYIKICFPRFNKSGELIASDKNWDRFGTAQKLDLLCVCLSHGH